MALGPGKYDALVTRIMDEAPAQGVILDNHRRRVGQRVSAFRRRPRLPLVSPRCCERSLTGSSAILSRRRYDRGTATLCVRAAP